MLWCCLQQGIFQPLRRKLQCWSKEGFLWVMPCPMILRFSTSGFLCVLRIRWIYKYRLNFFFLLFLKTKKALLLSHPRKDLRDTSEYQPFLKYLSSYIMNEFLISIIIILHAKMTIITWVIVKAGDDAGRHSGILQLSFLVLRSRVENTAL